MSKKDNIYITRPTLPDLEEFIPYLRDIWETRSLTNNGKYHQQLEEEMASFLGVKYLSLFANGTLAIITSLKALHITGEVITTPYSFVATTNSLIWNNLKPVFVDIEPNWNNIDPEKIEAAITENTSAVLPVHVYGNPCDVKLIEEIADKHGLKIIYDAAHAFGNKLNGESILNFGDLSIVSFHATKPFNTFEGGAVISHDKHMKTTIDHLKNFGFVDETTVTIPGMNSKMNELQASLGLLQLRHHTSNIDKRRQIADIYKSELSTIKGISYMPEFEGLENYNYSYFPIFICQERYGRNRNELYDILIAHHIYGRRYFYPLISQFQPYKKLDSAKPENLPVAEKTANEVICLPIYPELSKNDAIEITKVINKNAK